MPTTVWAPDALPELDGRTGFVQTDDSVAATLLAADKVQSPGIGALYMRTLGSGAAAPPPQPDPDPPPAGPPRPDQGPPPGVGPPSPAPALTDERAEPADAAGNAAGTYGTREMTAGTPPARKSAKAHK